MQKSKMAMAAIILIVTAMLAVGCTNNGGNTDSDVRVTTYSSTDITATTAKCGGDVVVAQGLSLTEFGVCWSKEQHPTVDQSHHSTTVCDKPFVCTITNLERNTKYYVRAYALRGLVYYYGEEKSFTTAIASDGVYNGHEYVDLGLPSGTLWATCNVGADTPEDYGDHFAWGETTPKDTYEWSTYRYCNGDYHQLTKYCCDSHYGDNGFTDTLTVLLPEDDAATANWGDGWCMPTVDQWRELSDNTIAAWTTQNGVEGRLLTALNGNSLFLPAAGYRCSDELYDAGRYGYYWSSSLVSDYPYYAWYFYFRSDYYGVRYDGRYYGFTVRPVRSARQN